MTFADLLGVSRTQERTFVRAMQAVLAGVLVYGLVTFQLGMAANGLLALSVTALPALLRREFDYTMDAGLALWITVSIFLHSIGALGPYVWFPWYDNITHTVSASVIAGVGYATLRALEVNSDDIDVPPPYRAVFIVVFVLAVGVVWELVEFASGGLAAVVGGRAPLVVRGIDDIVTDFVFNAIGAVVVAVLATDHFSGLAAFFARRLDSS